MGGEFFGIQFLTPAPFTDEARFGRVGTESAHGQQQQAQENPRGTVRARHQDQLRTSVWAITVGDCLEGPHA
jgi:hypothetical protein